MQYLHTQQYQSLHQLPRQRRLHVPAHAHTITPKSAFLLVPAHSPIPSPPPFPTCLWGNRPHQWMKMKGTLARAVPRAARRKKMRMGQLTDRNSCRGNAKYRVTTRRTPSPLRVIRTRTRIHAHTHTHTRSHTHTHLHTYTHTYTHSLTHVCVYVCEWGGVRVCL